jgi:hypothetical protein
VGFSRRLIARLPLSDKKKTLGILSPLVRSLVVWWQREVRTRVLVLWLLNAIHVELCCVVELFNTCLRVQSSQCLFVWRFWRAVVDGRMHVCMHACMHVCMYVCRYMYVLSGANQ